MGNRLLAYWKNQSDVSFQNPVGQEEIKAFEKLNNVAMPDDFKNYLNRANGFNQSDCYQDIHGFNFWPIENICRVSEYDEGKFSFKEADSYFIFCDYLDFCWGYAINLNADNKENKVIMIATKDNIPIVVSKNFSEFVDAYLRDDERLYNTVTR